MELEKNLHILSSIPQRYPTEPPRTRNVSSGLLLQRKEVLKTTILIPQPQNSPSSNTKRTLVTHKHWIMQSAATWTRLHTKNPGTLWWNGRRGAKAPRLMDSQERRRARCKRNASAQWNIDWLRHCWAGNSRFERNVEDYIYIQWRCIRSTMYLQRIFL